MCTDSAYPNVTDDFILDTDASGTAIGAELIQVQGVKSALFPTVVLS